MSELVYSTTTGEQPRFNVQCLNGHVGEVPVGSELEQRCIERAEEGFLDALCVSYDECPECQYRSQQDREMACDMGAFDALSPLSGEPLDPSDREYMSGWNYAKSLNS